jgi:Beta-propeller repeat
MRRNTMQTPSPRKSAVVFVTVAVVTILSFFFIVNHHTKRAASNNEAAQQKAISANNAAPVSTSLKQDWLKAYGKLPLSFEQNQGQHAADVQFLSRGDGYDLSLMAGEVDFNLRQSTSKHGASLSKSKFLGDRRHWLAPEKVSVLRMRLEGSNPNASIAGVDRTPTKVNYFVGNDPKKWHADVPAYAKVKYAGIYPGVDLVFYGNRRELEYDFVVAPGADAKAIALEVEGARKMRLDRDGNIVISVPGGAVDLKKPNAYQELNGMRREVAGNYTISNHHEVRFAVADYDRTQPLIIDPVVTYSTYLGGSGAGGDIAYGIALDAAGDAYVAGVTSSPDLMQVNGIGGIPTSVTIGNTSAFVAELNPAGTQALYLTYLGGSTNDGAFAVAVDTAGNIYVTGMTESSDFPTGSTNTPFQKTAPAGVNLGGAAFVTRLDPTMTGTAQLVYSTFLGGIGSANGGDFGNGIAVSGTGGNAFVTGEALSTTGFPTVNATTAPFSAVQLSPAGNAFVSEINTSGNGAASLLFSTILGGTGAGSGGFDFGDYGAGIAVDSTSNAYIVGTTTSPDFPTQGTALTSCTLNTTSSAFLSVINLATPTAPVLSYSSCLAGSTAEIGNAIALGPANLVFLTGQTFSTDFPLMPKTGTIPLGFPGTVPAGVPNANSGVAFVSTVNATAGTLSYSTLLGGNNGDTGLGIAADSAGVAYVTGQTGSADFPLTPGAFQATRTNGAGSAFIAKVNASAGGNGGQDLLYSTYYGGNGDGAAADPDAGNAIAVNGTPPGTAAYVAGQATAGMFTTPGAYHTATNNPAGLNAFVAELPLVGVLSVSPTSLSFGSFLVGSPTPAQTLTITNNSSTAVAIPLTISGANSADFTTVAGVTPCAGSLPVASSCTVGVIFTPTVVGAETGTLQIGTGANALSVALTGAGSATGAFTVTAPATFSLTSGTAGSIPVTITGTQGFTGTVNLTCAGAAPVTSCTMVPTSVTITAGAPSQMADASVVATLSFVAPPESMRTPPSTSLRQVAFLILGIAVLFMIPMTQRRRTRLGMAAAMLVFVAVAGCGGGGGHHTGTGSVTITGTATGVTAPPPQSATVSLTITQ